ncbi:MAG: RidA family protein [Proteobacteria bacterium]|nr:RidA family protein [Pseudomonadota bacterium]
MKKKVIQSSNAPAAIGPYSQAIQIGNLLFLSGQIGLDPTTSALVSGGVTSELHQIFKNIEAVISSSGSNLSQVVKLTIYLKKIDDFSILNEVMQQYLQAPFPARTTIEVSGLPKNANAEIEAVVAL